MLLGKRGQLKAIFQEDYGHKVAIDLGAGIIFIDYETWELQNGTIGIGNPRSVIFICHDTLIAGDLFHLDKTEPNEEGWYEQKVRPLKWRPIWFSRVINNIPTKIIGAQTTLPKVYGGKNVKKMVMLFPDGRLGIF